MSAEWLGASVTASMFVLGKFLIGLYVGKSGVVSRFWAVGTVVTLLVWVYYLAQIFLLGAEFTRIYANERAAAEGNRCCRKSERWQAPARAAMC
ncbi:MAG: YhjD/YihY/BrkB family envelope integrity protein [Aestuariivirga sp.]